MFSLSNVYYITHNIHSALYHVFLLAAALSARVGQGYARFFSASKNILQDFSEERIVNYWAQQHIIFSAIHYVKYTFICYNI